MTMEWIDVQLTVAPHDPRCVPDVRLWVDLQTNGALDTEMEVPLRVQQERWSGSFLQNPALCSSFLYRLGVFAHPGAAFWLSLRARRSGCQLLLDGDVLDATKCVLVGTCSVASLIAANDQRLPRLTLLHGGKLSSKAEPSGVKPRPSELPFAHKLT
jgi:hypothetical protein